MVGVRIQQVEEPLDMNRGRAYAEGLASVRKPVRCARQCGRIACTGSWANRGWMRLVSGSIAMTRAPRTETLPQWRFQRHSRCPRKLCHSGGPPTWQSDA